MILSGATWFFTAFSLISQAASVYSFKDLFAVEGNDAFRAKKSTNSESAMCHFDACICPVGGLDLTVQCPQRKKKKAEKARADATLRSRVDVLARPPASDGLDRKRPTRRARRERCTTPASLSLFREASCNYGSQHNHVVLSRPLRRPDEITYSR